MSEIELELDYRVFNLIAPNSSLFSHVSPSKSNLKRQLLFFYFNQVRSSENVTLHREIFNFIWIHRKNLVRYKMFEILRTKFIKDIKLINYMCL